MQSGWFRLRTDFFDLPANLLHDLFKDLRLVFLWKKIKILLLWDDVIATRMVT